MLIQTDGPLYFTAMVVERGPALTASGVLPSAILQVENGQHTMHHMVARLPFKTTATL